MIERDFFDCWFEGVNDFLGTAPDGAVAEFIDRCAEACSVSYSRGVYERAFSGGKNLDEGLEALRREFADFDYTRDGNRVEIRYSRCGCDLVSAGKISSPRLCECSVASCRKNWEAVFGPGSVEVSLRESVLRGDGRCVLLVTLSADAVGL